VTELRLKSYSDVVEWRLTVDLSFSSSRRYNGLHSSRQINGAQHTSQCIASTELEPELTGVCLYLPMAINALLTFFWGGGFIKGFFIKLLHTKHCGEFCNVCNCGLFCIQKSIQWLLSNEFFSVLEYTKIDVCWGFAPYPTGGAYSDPQTP